jgi:hypothetical protein
MAARFLLLVLPAFSAEFRAVLTTADQIPDGYPVVVLQLGHSRDQESARSIRKSAKSLYYWIEVARNAELANAHPEWMASLQGHQQWRRLFPAFPSPGEGVAVKNFPWVPILYKEAFDAHLERISRLLAPLPQPDGIFLNDLQGAPSACGCGNDLCRWTSDYGPIRSATPLGKDAAARFVEAVKKRAPRAEIIPVWTTECEHEDKATRCADVGCFAGLCWREWTAQLMPLAAVSPRIAVLALRRTLGRRDAAWVGRAIQSFEKMPPQRAGQGIAAARIIAVVEKGEPGPTGTAGWIEAAVPLDQGWSPWLGNASK